MRKKRIRDMAIALIVAGLIAFFTQPIYTAGGDISYPLMMLFIGIPFGVRRMFLWLIPTRSSSIGTAAGIVVLNLLVGGLIGFFVFALTILLGVASLIAAATSAVFRK